MRNCRQKTNWLLQVDHDQSAGQKCWCLAPRDNGGGQRTRVRAAEAWLGTLSPSCHLAQTEGSGPHHAGLAQKTRTGEGFIHPPTSFIQQTNLRPVDDAAVLVFFKSEIGALKQFRKPCRCFILMYNSVIIHNFPLWI